MKIGILAAGHAPRSLIPEFGDYAAMFQALLAGRGYDWRVFDTPAGDYPDRPEACDAYIVTGASAGVYDGEPWIDTLLEFLRAARGRARMVGVCFGHQAMAQAFGGRVIKSPKGWGVGLHAYDVAARRPWMDDARQVSLSASHQDQVAEPPPTATVIAGSDFCPYAMLAYDDAPAISIQPHPEFAPAFSAALIEKQRGRSLSDEQADAAVKSLQAPDDHARVGDWIGRFLGS
jgi:GMP synthase-like glutamine amidotransferase